MARREPLLAPLAHRAIVQGDGLQCDRDCVPHRRLPHGSKGRHPARAASTICPELPPPPSIPPLVAPIPYRAERPPNRAESKSGQIWSLGWRPSSAPRMAPLISPSDGCPHQSLGWCLAGAADLVGAGHALARVERAAGAPRSPNLLVHVHPLPAGDAARLLGRPDAHLGLNIALSDRHACGYDADHRRRRRRSLHRNRHRGL